MSFLDNDSFRNNNLLIGKVEKKLRSPQLKKLNFLSAHFSQNFGEINSALLVGAYRVSIPRHKNSDFSFIINIKNLSIL